MSNKLDLNLESEEIDKKSWEDMFELTKAYFEHYGNLSPDANFKTLNGIDPDENGVNLFNWINSQLQKMRSKSMINFLIMNPDISHEEKMRVEKYKKLTDEQVQSLVSIGFRINTFQANYVKVKELLSKYDITNTEIIFSLRTRSYIDLCAIEDYLVSNGLPVIENGKLHEMFYMNGEQTKESFGFYKHELISSYISKPEPEVQKKLAL